MEQLTLDKFLQLKKCTTCKEFKTVDNFCKDSSRKDGLSYKCKVCNSKTSKRYHNENKEKEKNRHNNYYQKTKETRKEKNKLYRNTHKEQHKKYYENYKVLNAGKIALKNRKLYYKNREKYLEICKKYRKTTNGKEVNVRAKAKRRSLGFNPINERFDGAEYHHLRYNANGMKDNNIGIYIPRELHRSIYHNGFTGQGMDEMNKSAMEWYISTGGDAEKFNQSLKS